MGFDRLGFGLEEPEVTILATSGTTAAASQGVHLDNPQYQAAAFHLQVSPEPGETTLGAAFDAVVQTAALGASSDEDWSNLTSSRRNGIVDSGVYDAEIVDPVLDLLRLRLISQGGDLSCTIQVRWLADRSFSLL